MEIKQRKRKRKKKFSTNKNILDANRLHNLENILGIKIKKKKIIRYILRAILYRNYLAIFPTFNGTLFILLYTVFASI